MDIAEVALRAGVSASALRYYEHKGLIASVGRHGLRRQFSPGVLHRLALIALARSAGFSLAQIALMLTPDGQVQIDRAMFAAKADELDDTLTRLGAMRDALRKAAACPAPSHMECPNFRRYLTSAANQELATRTPPRTLAAGCSTAPSTNRPRLPTPTARR